MPAEAAPPVPARRTRLTPQREKELYEAVLDLLQESGYEALTMDAVAARTRSSKATLYRQWKGKPELVATALRHTGPPPLEDIDTGTLRGDLQEMARCADASQMEREAALMRGLGQAVHQNPDLYRAFRELVIEPELAGLDTVLRRAVARGELPAESPAVGYVPHMMIGAIVARPLLEGRPADPDYLARFIDAVVLPALGA